MIISVLNLLYHSRTVLEAESAEKQHKVQPMEMLTIKECTEAVKGLSEHTVRKLVTQGKVHYIRICSVILR